MDRIIEWSNDEHHTERLVMNVRLGRETAQRRIDFVVLRRTQVEGIHILI
jgi:hypothetical protein